PYPEFLPLVGAAPASATYLTVNNETANLPNSRRVLAGTNVTFDDSVAGQRTINASGSSSSSGGTVGGHLHGLMRILGDGVTTVFNLLDIAEYLEHIADNGSIVDPLNLTLSADRAKVTFSVAPVAGHVLSLEYVIANA
ncbi:MAG TPA: hypothetical protein VF456_16995, partial [Vicinamibacterales bacterium]